MVNKSLSGSLDVQLKFYSQVKNSSKKKNSNFCALLVHLHLTGDMSQGQSQESHLKINLGSVCVCVCTHARLCVCVCAKSEKHNSTYLLPLGQKESKSRHLLEG